MEPAKILHALNHKAQQITVSREDIQEQISALTMKFHAKQASLLYPQYYRTPPNVSLLTDIIKLHDQYGHHELFPGIRLRNIIHVVLVEENRFNNGEVSELREVLATIRVIVYIFSEETEEKYLKLVANLKSEPVQGGQAIATQTAWTMATEIEVLAITEFMGVPANRRQDLRANGYLSNYDDVEKDIYVCSILNQHFGKAAQIVLAARGTLPNNDIVVCGFNLWSVLRAIIRRYPQMKNYFEDFRGDPKLAALDADTPTDQAE